jgi:hypothetical protein
VLDRDLPKIEPAVFRIFDASEDAALALPSLAISEGRPRYHGKLIAAGGAFPELTRRVSVGLEASALRAVRLAVIIGPSDRLEAAWTAAAD